MYSALLGRKICLSHDGYFGVVPEEAKENVLTCVFLGMTVPLIPRGQYSGYILIGDCYIRVLMEGEVV